MTVKPPVRRGRKPSVSSRSVKDPGPIVSQWYTAKRELDKALDKVGEIAERMNTLGMLAKTRFEIDLPFVSRNGTVRNNSELAGAVAPQQSRPPQEPEFESASDWTPPPQTIKKSSSSPLPVQGPTVTKEGIEITTSPLNLDVGREGNLRAAAANKMGTLQRMLG